jgi:uncharacterized phage protein gp47/JayE
MPLFSESEEKILGEILTDIVETTSLTRVSPGALTRTFAESVSRKLGRMWTQFDLNMVQAFLDGAEGQYLNFFGNMFGIPRLEEQAARLTTQDRLLKFYVDSGVFGNINSLNSITIPAGTFISTGPDNTGIVYRTVVTTILAANQSSTYVSAESVRTGSISNVGARQLRYHSFTNYTDVANNTLKVVNEAELNLARDIETDTNYRFRLANALPASEQANLISVRLAALAVPGVADLVILPFHRGIGTYDMLIKSTTPNISFGLVGAVQQAIDRVTSFGIVGTARGPIEVGVSVIGNLTMKRVLSPQEESNIVSAVTQNITNYINGLDIGEEMIINEMIERVMSSSDLIKNIGSAVKPFENLYKYQPSKLNDTKTRSTLLTDLVPASEERIIVENRFAGNTPILFRVV